MSTPISLQSVTHIGLATLRVRFTAEPKLTDAADVDDGLNPANYILSGESTNYVTSVTAVVEDPQAVDLSLAALLDLGAWTLAVTSIVSADGGALTSPTSMGFEITTSPTQASLAGGAVNMDVVNVLRKHLNPALRGKGWDSLMAAVAAGDAINWENAKLAFNQLYLSSASGVYLDRRAGDQGLRRPPGVEMSDELFRDLAIISKTEKLTQESILDILEVFYGTDALRASITTTVNEPFALTDGDELRVLIDDRQDVVVTFHRNEFSRIAAAQAVEVAASITRALRTAGTQAFAVAVTDDTTGETAVRIYSGSLGIGSSVMITGGRAQTELLFPESLFPEGGSTPFATWDVTLSPTTLGNVRFTQISGIYDFNVIREGDLVYIYGSEFEASTNQGVFELDAVRVSYSGSTLVQWFEIVNPSGTAENPISQTNFKDLMFFRPVRKTIYDASRHVIVAQTGSGVDIVMPATTQVSREPGQAAYLPGRAEPNNDPLPTNGLKLFLEADHGVTESGGFVSSQLDKSAFGNHVAQSDPGSQPTLVLNAINGHPGIDFGGEPGLHVATPYLENSSSNLVDVGGARTIISVVKPLNDEGGSIIEFHRSSADYVAYLIKFFGVQYAWSDGFSAIQIPGAVDYTDTPLLVEHINDASLNFELNINGSSVPLSSNTIGPESTFSDGFVIGNRAVSNDTPYDQGFNGIICMVMVYDRVLEPSELDIIRRYVKRKYNIDAGAIAAPTSPSILDVSSLIRRNGTVTVETVGDHGLSVGDHVIVDGARSSNARPATSPGTPSGDYSSDIATGTTDVSLKTTASLTGTYSGFGQKALRLAEGMALIVGGLQNTYSPIANPSILEITGETIGADGSRQESYKWTRLATHTATTGHREFGASVLADGRVLVTGGTDGTDAAGASNDRFNLFTYTRAPVQDTMVDGALPGVRAGHAQASLQDGNAIICGGWVIANTPIATTRLFNATSQLWSAKASLNHVRMRHRAITLNDGTVLVMGGQTDATVTLNSCEIYDPIGNTWTDTCRMSYARTRFEVVLLPDGRVLVIGGIGYNPTQSTTPAALDSCEIYDPITRLWSPLNRMFLARESCVAEYVAAHNCVYVAGGTTSDPNIEKLDLTTMKWSLLPVSLASPRYRGASVVIGEDTLALIGGADSYNLTTPTTDKKNYLVVPGTEAFGGSGLNGIQKVLTVPDASTFTYETPDQLAYSESVSGATVTPMSAIAAPTGVPGPFTYDMEHGVAITATDATMVSEVKAGQRYQSIEVDDATEFPDETGYVVFNFGQTEQVAPVKYLGRLSNTELALDASFKFPFDVAPGSEVVLLSSRSPFQPPANVRPGNFYLTGSAAGRIAAEAALADTVAAGVDVRKTIVYPDDNGLGGEGLPTSGTAKLSDKVRVWGGDDLDAEIAALRTQS